MHFLCILGCLSFLPSTGTLRIKVEYLQNANAPIRMALYDHEQNFLQEGKSIKGVVLEVAAQSKSAIHREPKLPFGSYALAVYQDLNGDGQLNKNKLGIPTEPYGFSNNVKSKWRSPKFTEAVFQFQRDEQQINIVLQKWSER
jgi:uncharacterized protein (DUF2141 family)